MTLSEYLQQSEPVAAGSVVLSETDCQKWLDKVLGCWVVRLEMFGQWFTYRTLNVNTKGLWSFDESGALKSRSVFTL